MGKCYVWSGILVIGRGTSNCMGILSRMISVRETLGCQGYEGHGDHMRAIVKVGKVHIAKEF